MDRPLEKLSSDPKNTPSLKPPLVCGWFPKVSKASVGDFCRNIFDSPDAVPDVCPNQSTDAKARYTLATKLTVADMVDFVAGFIDKLTTT